MTGVESVGDMVTGGLIARTVEPSAGESEGHGTTCLNCGTALIGDYCHRCGQAGRVHRTLSAIWHDIAHSVLHFEGKIWHTLPLLAWRPGALTRRYIDGERARFVSPMALFLFSVFLMFAVFTAVGGPFSFDDPVNRTEAAQDLNKERAELQGQIGKLESEIERLRAAGLPTRAVDMSLEGVRAQLATIDATAQVIATGTEEEVSDAIRGDAFMLGDADVIGLQTGWPPLDAAIEKANENPSLLLYKIQTNAYKFSWALIPISVPFVWLIFLHRRRYWGYRLYDHTVFVTYSISFMSLGLIALSLLRPLGLGEAVIGLAISFVPPIHMYRQLRGTYALSRFSAIWRTFVLLVFASIAASLFLVLLLALGAFA